MRLPLLAVALCAVSACVPAAQVSKIARLKPASALARSAACPPSLHQLAQVSMARDFMDLTFAMENGRDLPTFSRFEGPVTVALAGDVPADGTARPWRADRRGCGPRRGSTSAPTNGRRDDHREFATASDLRRLAPTAACFVVPNVTSLAEYRRQRGSDAVDWAQVTQRDRAAIFIPADTSPQEVRDCLHEELAQALGPLNDLYRLPDSVFNDDNFHSVLTGFDMADPAR